MPHWKNCILTSQVGIDEEKISRKTPPPPLIPSPQLGLCASLSHVSWPLTVFFFIPPPNTASRAIKAFPEYTQIVWQTQRKRNETSA